LGHRLIGAAVDIGKNLKTKPTRENFQGFLRLFGTACRLTGTGETAKTLSDISVPLLPDNAVSHPRGPILYFFIVILII
jgi:hypothetical protein